MKPTISTIRPAWAVNYDEGYVGFTAHTDDLVGDGIAWFERWDDKGKGVPDVVVTHALIVSGQDECIEAHAGSGVSRSNLHKYFNDPHCLIFFRKPRGWSMDRGEKIVDTAASHIGEKYGYGVIFADLLANSFLGHWLNRFTANVPNRIVSKLLDRPGAEICSELVANVLQEQDWIRYAGSLDQPARMVKPQDLFEDNVTFSSWKQPSDFTDVEGSMP